MIRFQENPVIISGYRVFTRRAATASNNPGIGSRAIDFYKLLGFEVFSKLEYDDVIIIKNSQGVEINLITSGNAVTMPMKTKHPHGCQKNTRAVSTWRMRLSVLSNALRQAEYALSDTKAA